MNQSEITSAELADWGSSAFKTAAENRTQPTADGISREDGDTGYLPTHALTDVNAMAHLCEAASAPGTALFGPAFRFFEAKCVEVFNLTRIVARHWRKSIRADCDLQ